MTLHDIETVLRKNFVFEKEETARKKDVLPNYWRTVEHLSCNNNKAGIIVFCGIAWVYGFSSKEVREHAGLSLPEHTSFLAKFKQALNEHKLSEMQPLFSTKVNAFIIKKAQMIMNAIDLQHKRKFVSLTDFNF